MIVEPERYVADFAKAGADLIIVHQEVSPHLHRTVEQIKGLGKRAGVAINPATPLATIQEILDAVDLLLVMTVDPGFGGQSFIASTMPKLQRLRSMLDARGATCDVEVDGGISAETAPRVVEAGATVLVAGSAIYGDPEGPRAAIAKLRAALG